VASKGSVAGLDISSLPWPQRALWQALESAVAMASKGSVAGLGISSLPWPQRALWQALESAVCRGLKGLCGRP